MLGGWSEKNTDETIVRQPQRRMSTAVDPETQAIAALMIAAQIRDEWFKIGGTADCRAIVHYHEGTDRWEAWPARDDLTVKDRRTLRS